MRCEGSGLFFTEKMGEDSGKDGGGHEIGGGSQKLGGGEGNGAEEQLRRREKEDGQHDPCG